MPEISRGETPAARLAVALTEPLRGKREELRLALQQSYEQHLTHAEGAPRPGEVTLAEAEEKVRAAREGSPHLRERRLTRASRMLLLCLVVAIAAIVPEWPPLFEETPPALPSPSVTPAAYLAYVLQQRELPKDYDATWRRIDPDNAVWLYWKLDRMGEQMSDWRKKLNPAQEEILKQAVAVLDEASHMDRCDVYAVEMRKLVAAREGPAQSFGQAWSIKDRIGWPLSYEGLPGLHTDRVVWNEQMRLEALGDEPGRERLLKQLLRAETQILRGQAHDGDEHDPLPRSFSGGGGFVPKPRDPAQVTKWREYYRSWGLLLPGTELGYPRMAWEDNDDGGLYPPRLEGLALTWYLRVGQLALLAGALAAWLAALYFLRFHPRLPGRAREVAQGLVPLLDRRGILALTVWGGVAPVVWLALVTGRVNWERLYLNRWSSEPLRPALLVAGVGAVFVTLSLTVVARPRLSRMLRLVGLDYPGRGVWLGRAVLLLAYGAGLAAMSPSFLPGDPDLGGVWSVTGCLLAPGLLWLLYHAATGFFSLFSGMRHRLLGQWAAPALLAFTASLLIAVPVLRILEGHYAGIAVEQMLAPAYHPHAIEQVDRLFQELRLDEGPPEN